MKKTFLSYKSKSLSFNQLFLKKHLQSRAERCFTEINQRLFSNLIIRNSPILSKDKNKNYTTSLEVRKNVSHHLYYSTSKISENNLGDNLSNKKLNTSRLGFHSLIKTIPKYIKHAVFNHEEYTIYTIPSNLLKILYFLKNHTFTQYKILIDITAVDSPSQSLRFKLVYNLLSIKLNSRIKIETCIDEITPVQSLTQLFSCAGWWEREVWDMFGIFFSHHPDLRRILTDYGFQGHPLRKDFPLSGYVQVRYDDTEKKVITEPLEVAQEFRYFDFASPWQQLQKSA